MILGPFPMRLLCEHMWNDPSWDTQNCELGSVPWERENGKGVANPAIASYQNMKHSFFKHNFSYGLQVS